MGQHGAAGIPRSPLPGRYCWWEGASRWLASRVGVARLSPQMLVWAGMAAWVKQSGSGRPPGSTWLRLIPDVAGHCSVSLIAWWTWGGVPSATHHAPAPTAVSSQCLCQASPSSKPACLFLVRTGMAENCPEVPWCWAAACGGLDPTGQGETPPRDLRTHQATVPIPSIRGRGGEMAPEMLVRVRQRT